MDAPNGSADAAASEDTASSRRSGACQWLLPGWGAKDTPETGEIRSQQMATFARFTPINSAVTITTSLIAATALWDGVARAPLLAWAGSIWALALWHLYRWWRQRHRTFPNWISRRGPRKTAVWALLAGCLWGGSVVFFAETSDLHRIMLMLMTASMATGAIATLGVMPQAATLFIVFSFVPWLTAFLLQQEHHYLALAGMGTIFMLAMLASTRMVYANFIDSVRTRQQNAALLARFHSERDEWFEISDSSEAFALFDSEDRLLLWNESYRRIFSLPEEVLFRGAGRSDILRRAAMPVAVRDGAQTLEAWIGEQLELQEHPENPVVEQLSNGRWLRSSAQKTRLGHHATTHVDVTELKESEQRFRTMADDAPIMLWVYDEEDQPHFFNRPILEFFGKDLEEALAADLYDLVHPDDHERLRAVDREWAETPRPHKVDYRLRRADGEWRWVRDVCVPRFTSGGIFLGSIGSCVDITETKESLDALARSEARLTEAIEAMNEGFVLFDAEERLVVCNSRYREMYPDISGKLVPGVEFEDIVRAGADCGEVLESVGRGEAWIEERMARFRDPADAHEEHIRNGRWIKVAERRTEDGGIVGVRSDITELKAREAALRESERRFQDYAEASADWFWETDADLRFTYMSANVERIVGVPPEWHYGKTREELLAEGYDRKLWAEHLRALNAHEPFRDFVFPRAGEGIEQRWLRTSGIPLCSEDGTFLGYRGSGSDVTLAVLARTALEASEAQLRLVTDSLPVMIAYVDRDERFLFVNKTCTDWYARPREQLIGRHVGELLENRYEDYKPHIEAVLSGKKAAFERTVSYPDGRERSVQVLYVPSFYEAGEVVGFFVLCEDITERKRSQQALRERESRLHELQRQMEHVSRQSALGQLSSALAHELNQPLTAIMNYVQAGRRLLGAQKGPVPDKADEMFDKALEQSARAGDVIRRLRSLFERGENLPEPQHLNEVIEDAATIALVDAEVLGIQSKLNLCAEMPRLMIDKTQIQQVVLNLVRNSVVALQDSKRREITIATSCASEDAVEVVVSDTGPGLPKDLKDRLFDAFVSGTGQGMGMGLSISQRIIKAHNGRLWAEPNPV